MPMAADATGTGWGMRRRALHVRTIMARRSDAKRLFDYIENKIQWYECALRCLICYNKNPPAITNRVGSIETISSAGCRYEKTHDVRGFWKRRFSRHCPTRRGFGRPAQQKKYIEESIYIYLFDIKYKRYLVNVGYFFLQFPRRHWIYLLRESNIQYVINNERYVYLLDIFKNIFIKYIKNTK